MKTIKSKSPLHVAQNASLANALNAARAMSPAKLRRTILAPDPHLSFPMYNGGASKSGQVCLMNEALFTQDHFSEPLTTFATGWKDPEDIGALMDFIAPPVEVGRRFEFKQAVNAEEFIIEVNEDIRAIGASFKEVTYTDSTVNGKTLNKGLTIRLDNDQYTDPAKAEKMLTAKVMRRLLRSEYGRILTLAAASAATTNVKWTAGSGVSTDPDADVLGIVEASHLSSGLYPNRLLCAVDALNKRFGLAGASNNPFGYAARLKTKAQDLADIVNVDKGMVSKAVYLSAANTKSALLSNLIYTFLAEDGVDTEDPTNIKRFWSATESGGPFRVYSQIYAKFMEVTVEHYSLGAAVSTAGVEALAIT